MNAEQARQKAIEVNTVTEKFRLDHLLRQIEDAAEHGYFYLDVYHSLSPSISEELKSRGFRVVGGMSRNEIHYRINW